jgi:gliding motility-associated-like protein
MRYIQLTFVFILITLNSFAQKQNNIWCFGDHAGLNFNTTTPTVLIGAQMTTNEGCASTADSLGNLLFYTDGITVWNKTHAIMPNGTGLWGSPSTTQSALIVPQPGSTTLYYIFTIGELGGSMNYTLVDMTLAGGNGGVVASSKNTSLHPLVAEKQCAFMRCDGNIWLISHEWNTNNFFADLITPTGINSTVISSVGVVHSGGNVAPAANTVGQIKISSQGNKLALAIRDMGTFSVFDFDVNTGVVANPIVTSANYTTAYGVEFSPDGTKLYGTTLVPGAAYQFDLMAGNASAISASAVQVGSYSNLMCSVQLASNGKVYIAKSQNQTIGSSAIDVINFPNNSSGSIGYVSSGTSISPNQSLLGLPTLLVRQQTIPNISVAGDTLICNGQQATLTATGGITYTWSGGINATGSSVILSPTTATTCYVTSTNACGADTDTITINIANTPNVGITGTTAICSGQSTTLTAFGSGNYTWSGGATSNATSITVSPTSTTKYYITSTNVCGSAKDSITVNVTTLPIINLAGNNGLCAGQTTTLIATGSTSYTWSGGANSTNDSITVSPLSTTKYYVSSTNSCGTTTDSVLVTVNAKPIINATHDTSVCAGSTVNLSAYDGNVYTWLPTTYLTNANSATPIAQPMANITYVVTVSKLGCTTTDTVNIVVTTNSTYITIAGNATICKGDSVQLVGNVPHANYVWNTTANTPSIYVKNTGSYWLTTTDANGCKGTDTVLINVLNKIKASNDTDVCKGEYIHLLATGSVNGTYSWSPTVNMINNTSANPYVQVTTSGYYYVSATDGCNKDSVYVIANPLPVLIARKDTGIYYGELVQLYASGSSPIFWNPATSLNCYICATPIAKPDSTTLYTVQTINKHGCMGIDTVLVTVLELTTLYVPNSFTPNHDGVNDGFRPYHNALKTIEWEVYNRWGELIYETNNLTDFWDGTYKDKLCQDGVYVYKIKATTKQSKHIVKAGVVTLFR